MDQGRFAAWLPVSVLVVCSVGLFALISYTDRRSDAAGYRRSAAFVESATSICTSAAARLRPPSNSQSWRSHAAAVLDDASHSIAVLAEPPNVHRAVARLVYAWRTLASALLAGSGPSSSPYRKARKQSIAAADRLNVKTCMHTVSD